MHIHADLDKAFALLDTLLVRWKRKEFPYNKKDAVIPQTLVPDDLRKDKMGLARFYFYACIYMRGGIESVQAFEALFRMRKEHPSLFDPFCAHHLTPSDVEKILKEFIGWDSKAASRSWVENSWSLVWHWNGDPFRLIQNVNSYEEALRRMRNKRTKRDRKDAGYDGAGFRGFQPKMVSMLLYFYDWEGWLRPRFLYPTPADFHNFRLGLTTGAIMVSPEPAYIRTDEKISAPWRDAVMTYLRARKADPIEVADALWLFSLVMCGNSPLTTMREAEVNGSGMFAHEDLPHHTTGAGYFMHRRFRNALETTCLRCPVRDSCMFAIPSAPYYRKGKLVLTPRFRIEEHIQPVSAPLSFAKTNSVVTGNLFEPDR